MKSLFYFIIALVSCNLYSQQDQAFNFHVKRVLQVLEQLGHPVPENDKAEIQTAVEKNQSGEIGKILEKYTLLNVVVNPESRVAVKPGKAKPELWQSGWKTFLVKVENQAGITAELQISSPQAKRDYDGGERIYGMAGVGKGETITEADIRDRWLDASLYTQNPMKPTLSGLPVDYFIVQLYSRDAGKRQAAFTFNCGEATQDIGMRNEADILFECLPSKKIRMRILDENKNPTTASLVIKDSNGNVYPSQAKRLAPDFFFQQQIYRADGEFIDLPEGKYTLQYGRGPEYLSKTSTFDVTKNTPQEFVINLERWIDPSKYGWYSGDHHIHAAGCSHYTSPTQGVDPADIFRHLLGEAVNVGSVLTWGQGYAHQKQFFEGKENKLSKSGNLMRYDLEISGFPSSHTGHLVLLRLKDQYYPGTKTIEDWPTYSLPILKWAKSQGAIVGFAHTGFGLNVESDALPNYKMPKFDGIGANEYVVAVTQNLVDFISTMDTPPTWELNLWYHTLNCGFRARISGETDFPCITDERAQGRSYVKLDKNLNFDDWTEGIKLGRCYTSEGKSHIIDFRVNDVEVGTKNSEVKLSRPSKVKVTAKVAARLNEKADPAIRRLNTHDNIWGQKPFWNLERVRIGNTRTVAVELIVNGESVESKTIEADGKLRDISFETTIDKSSWIALRILYSSHSNPIFVTVDDKPIRANKKSAQWCKTAVDVCWEAKKGMMSQNDRIEAEKQYSAAKAVYQTIIDESN